MPTLEELQAANADLQKKHDALVKEREGKVLFAQADLDKMFAERGKQGEQAREKELLKAFGFEKVEDAQTALAEFKKLQDGQKSELEKAQQANAEWQKKFDALTKERDDANKARDDALGQVKSGLIRAAVMTEATKQNFRDDALDDVWLIVDKSKLKVNDANKVLGVVGDKDTEGVAEIIKEIAKQKPHWLKTRSGAGGTPRQGGSGGQRDASDGDKELAERTRRQYTGRF